MHIFEHDDTRIHHNGGFEGNVSIIHNGQRLEVPFAALKALVANYVRGERINALEQAGSDEILKGRGSDEWLR